MYSKDCVSVLNTGGPDEYIDELCEKHPFLSENYGIDSNYQAMSWFANADLLIEQHKYDEAFILFDSIIKAFPYHSLSDEIYFNSVFTHGFDCL